MSDPHLFSLPLDFNFFWSYLRTASMIVTLPVLLSCVFFSGYFIEDIRCTGSKG